MTRKDYIAIASALADARAEVLGRAHYSQQTIQACEDGVLRAATFIAMRMEADNPRFDRDHFLAVVRGEKALGSRPARS